jgi:hypothetical protein
MNHGLHLFTQAVPFRPVSPSYQSKLSLYTISILHSSYVYIYQSLIHEPSTLTMNHRTNTQCVWSTIDHFLTNCRLLPGQVVDARCLSRSPHAKLCSLSPDTAVIPCGNRTRRDPTHGPFTIIYIICNSDYEAQLALFTIDIIVLRADCYVGVCATHALPCACAIGGLELLCLQASELRSPGPLPNRRANGAENRLDCMPNETNHGEPPFPGMGPPRDRSCAPNRYKGDP